MGGQDWPWNCLWDTLEVICYPFWSRMTPLEGLGEWFCNLGRYSPGLGRSFCELSCNGWDWGVGGQDWSWNFLWGALEGIYGPFPAGFIHLVPKLCRIRLEVVNYEFSFSNISGILDK